MSVERAERLRRSLLEQIKSLGGIKRLVVAYSGGLDSTALLHLCKSLHLELSLQALHINHQLHSDSEHWVERCRAQAQAWDIPFHTRVVFPSSDSEGEARNARYRAFEAFLEPGDILLQAHHLDDQAETLIFRLMRGTGLRGLKGIARERVVGRARLFRPFLGIARAELRAYLKEQQIEWIDDPSNRSDRYARGQIRTELTPVLDRLYPKWQERLNQTAQQVEYSESLLAELAQQDLLSLVQNNRLSLEPLQKRSFERFSNALLYWLRECSFETNHFQRFESLARQLYRCDIQSTGCWDSADLRLHLYRKTLYLETLPPPKVNTIELEAQPGRYQYGGSNLELFTGEGLAPGQRFTVRARKPGECILIPDRGRVPMKKLMNELRIPPWLRDRWPLVEVDGEVIGLVDYWLNEQHVTPEGIALKWHV